MAADGLAGAWHRLGLRHTALPKQFLETLWEEAQTKVHPRSACGYPAVEDRGFSKAGMGCAVPASLSLRDTALI